MRINCSLHFACTGELDAEKVPFWHFTGDYLKRDVGPANAKAEEVDGKGFCPWQYPEIHEKL
jgi:hypothetical protein